MVCSIEIAAGIALRKAWRPMNRALVLGRNISFPAQRNRHDLTSEIAPLEVSLNVQLIPALRRLKRQFIEAAAVAAEGQSSCLKKIEINS